MMSHFFSKCVGLALCLAGTSMQAKADMEVGDKSSQLEEIVVTAQKREESAQRVPIAVTAIDATRLGQGGVTNSVNLQFLVPGLEVSSLVGYYQPYIRGIGSDITQGVDNSVALYVDGVYIPTLTTQVQNLVAVDRVEVLKGPQGTLYGRNASGGAISVITKNPDLQNSSLDTSIGFGNFGEQTYTAYANLPLTSQLAMNVAVSYGQHHPYVTNLDAAAPQLRNAEDTVWRAKILYQPLDNLSFVLSGMGVAKQDDADDVQAQIQPNSLGSFFGGKQTTRAYDAYFNGLNRFDDHFQLYSLRGKAEFSPFDIVSISAYQFSRAHSATDDDGTSAPIFAFDVHNQAQTFTQELQVLSKPDSWMKWIGGLYYLSGQFEFSPVALIVAPAPSYIYSHDTTQSYAAFGQFTIPVTDKLNITAGARWTDEKKTIPIDNLVTAGGTVFSFGGPSVSWTKTTPKVSIDYEVLPTVMLWASAGQGWKSGGFNSTAPTNLGPVNPETLHAVEAGVKSEFADRRVRLNVSLFHYSVSNLQVQVVKPSASGGAALENAASSTIKGGEIELSAKVTNQLRLDAGFSAINGKYDNFPAYAGSASNAPGPGNTTIPINVSGQQITHSPKTSFNLGGTYEQPLPEGHLELNTTLSYSDKWYFDPQHLDVEPALTMLNGSIGYVSPDSKLRVTLQGSNLLDKVYYLNGTSNAFGSTVTYATPRTYGATISYRFL